MRLGSRIVDARDLITAVIFLAVSGVALADGIRLSQHPPAFRMNQTLKPGWYLILISALLFISGAIYMVSLIRDGDKVEDLAAVEPMNDVGKDINTGEAIDPGDQFLLGGRLLWIVVALVAYVLLIGVLGYVLATPIFFLAASLIFGVRKLITLFVLSLGFSALIVVLFIYLLRVRMPTGVFDLFNF
jgi:hypothetical protein